MKATFSKFNLDGKTALVTGGATGLGYHMTKALAEAGATVIVSARREDVLRDAAAELNRNPEIDGRVRWHRVDLADPSSVEALARHAIDTLGGIDILVGNAAQDFHRAVENIRDDEMNTMFQANIGANVQLTRAFLPGMRRKRWGRFIYSSSASSVVTSPFEGSSIYTAVKGALNCFQRTLATEAGHDNITANALILGFFVTDMVLHAQNDIRQRVGEAGARTFMEDFVGMTALGRAGNPAELEGLIQMLASDAGSYITGSCLVVDGGLSIMQRPNGMAE